MTSDGTLTLMAKEALTDVIERWDALQRREDNWLTAEMLTKAWIAGLRAAGVMADSGKVFVRGSKYPLKSPFMVEFPCPFGHRTEDKRFFATVQFLVDDDGWVSLDDDSKCPKCTIHSLERWLLTCPRCEAGDASADHTHCDERYNDDPVAANWVLAGGTMFGSSAPIAYVLDEFRRIHRVAEASWWVHHTADAFQWWTELARRLDFQGDYANPSIHLHLAKETLAREAERTGRSVLISGSASRAAQDAAGQPRSGWTDESAAAWLDALTEPQVDAVLTVRALWELIKDVPGRPPKNRAEAAQALRKSRRGSAT